MIRKSLLSVVLFLSAGATQAATPSTESIERLLTLTNSEALIDSMNARMEPFLRETMKGAAPAKLTPAQQKAMDDMVPKLIGLLREDLNWKQLKPDFVRIYQETLDQTEVDGLVAFYETPVGQSTIAKMPLVMQRSMELTQTRLQAIMPKVLRIAEESAKKAMQAK